MSKTDRRIEKGVVINEETDGSKKIRVTVSSGATTNTQTTLQSSQTANQTITLPDATDTLVGKATTDTLTNKTIDGDNNTVQDLALTSLKTNLTDANKFIVRDGSGIPVSNTKAVPTGDVVGTSDSQTLTNKTIAGGSNTISGLLHGTQVDNPSSGVHGVTGSVVGTSDSQTLSNKTLATPTITGTLEADAVTGADIGTSGSATTVNIGTGSGANTINIGGASSTINMTGTVNNQNVTNLNVTDKLITVNDGGAVSSGGGSGIEVEENAVITGYAQTSGDRNSWEFKAPNTAGVASLTPGASNDVVTLNAASQTLTNKTIDGDLNTVQDLALTSLKTVVGDANKFLVRDGSGIPVSNTKTVPSGDVVGTSDSQTLTNKTLTTPNIDIITLDGQASTPSNPSSGFYKAYVKDSTQKLTILDSAGVETTVGSGAGSFNYITANDGATIGDWITYDDGASSSPVDGTGGSPGATFVVSTSSAMRGTSNFLFTHDAADRQGEGFSYLMAIDPSDRGKVLRLTFDYLIASGVFADNGLAIWFYDATSSALIQPAPYLLKNSSLVERFSSEVQIPLSCASLRVIFHVTTATATAYTIRFDDFNFSNQAKLYGSPVIDWHDVTITGSWVTNTTYTGKRRIVGDTEYYDVKVETSGAPTATALSLTIPSTIDTNKLASTLASAKILDASASVYDSSPDEKYQALVAYNTTTSVAIRNDDGDGTHSNVTSTNPITFASGDSVHIRFSVPIVGRSSSVVMSSDADTRVVALAVTGDPASATSGNPIIFPTVTYDTHGGYNASTGRYTVPSPGYYRVHGYTNGDAAAITMKIYKNAVAQVNLGVTMPTYLATTMSGAVLCNAGDILDIRPDGTYNAASTSYLFIEKIQGSSQIAASDSMTARYTTAAGQSIDNATDEIIDYGTKDFDSHGSVTTGASWKFTAQVSGEFEVTASAAYTANATGIRQIALFKNNSPVSIIGYQPGNGSVTGFVSGTDRIKLLAGDYIDIRAYQNSGGGLALISSSGALYNHIKISRVGNY